MLKDAKGYKINVYVNIHTHILTYMINVYLHSASVVGIVVFIPVLYISNINIEMMVFIFLYHHSQYQTMFNI